MPREKLTTKSTIKNKPANKSAVADNLVIDWVRAKEQMNGNLEEAKHILKQLLIYIPEAQKDIRAAIKAKNNQKLLEHVHKLHGACSYCGVPRLKQAARSLESALRKNVAEQIQTLSIEVQNEIKLVLAVAKRDKILNSK